jgi:hypothetical protein
VEHPLEWFWLQHPPRPTFDDTTTSNRKNYTARWEIRESRLYLASFDAKRKGKSVAIDAILSGGKLPMLATWYSGKLHIGLGEVVGWEKGKPKYERQEVLDIEKGAVIGQAEKMDSANDLQAIRQAKGSPLVAVAPASGRGHKTIEELYAAYQSATENRDWESLYLLYTPERQDGEILMLAVTAATSKDATLRSLCEKHGANWKHFDHAWTEDDNRRFMQECPILARTLGKQVNGKKELFVAAMSHLDKKREPGSTKPRELVRLIRHATTAKGESVESVEFVERTFDARDNPTGQVMRTHSVVSHLWFRLLGGEWYLATDREIALPQPGTK